MPVIQPMWLREDEISALPTGWKAMQTSEATKQLKSGKLFDKKTVEKYGRIPVLSQGESSFIGFHNEQPGIEASPNSPVVTFANHTCATRLMKRPFSCIQNVFPKIGKDGICDTRFFYYAIQGRVNLADYKGHHPILRQTYIPIPPLPTQHKIASILSAYDDLIENNLRRIKILEEIAQNLYCEWFVKFRFPGYQNIRFVDSPLGKIPEGWEVARIDEIAFVYRGRSYRSKDLLDKGGLPFVNLKCINRDGGFRRDGLKHYSGQYKEHQRVTMGDIVMAVTDMTQERLIVAQAGRVPFLNSDFGVISMDLVKIVPVDGMSANYLYHYFRWSDFADNVKQYANGANVLHLLPDRIKEYEFTLPVKALRNKFSEISAIISEKVENLSLKNKVLRKTRDLLLPKLISGETDVSNLAIQTKVSQTYHNDIGRYSFVRQIVDLPFVDKIVLFGSRARGDHHSRSDIDLAVFCDQASEKEWQEVLYCLIEDRLDTLLKIDCVRFDAVNAALKEYIMIEGKTLYEKKPKNE